MKQFVMLLLLALSLSSGAQFNNTYDINFNGNPLSEGFVIPTNDLGSASVVNGSDLTVQPMDYFILTRLNAAGGVMFNTRINPNILTDHFIHVEAMVQTGDGGFLAAGFFYDINGVPQPFTTRVDGAGMPFPLPPNSTHVYNSNAGPFNTQLNKISMCRVENIAAEEYFVVCTSATDIGGAQTQITQVIRVNDLGNQIWSRKYYTNNAPNLVDIRDYPGDVQYGNGVYMIAGLRQQVTNGGVLDDLMYFFGIDINGNLIAPFKTYTCIGDPRDMDMTFNPNNNIFYVACTIEGVGFIPGATSCIGLVRLDAAVNFLAPNRVYWYPGVTRNLGRSISRNINNNNQFVICSTVQDAQLFINNPASLRINMLGLPVGNYVRYNINDNAEFWHHCPVQNPVTLQDQTVLIAGQNNDLRVIRADVMGNACGAVFYPPQQSQYESQFIILPCFIRDVSSPRIYRPDWSMKLPPFRECVPPGNSYRSITGISQTVGTEAGLEIYPTVLSREDARLTVVNPAGAELRIEVYTLTGQLVFSENHVAPGTSSILLDGSRMAEGMYLLKLYDAPGALTHSSKILVTK